MTTKADTSFKQDDSTFLAVLFGEQPFDLQVFDQSVQRAHPYASGTTLWGNEGYLWFQTSSLGPVRLKLQGFTTASVDTRGILPLWPLYQTGRSWHGKKPIMVKLSSRAGYLSAFDWLTAIETTFDAASTLTSFVDWTNTFDSTLRALKALVERFEREPFSRGLDDGERVSVETSRHARRFLEALPFDRQLPKIAPDGDGGLYMAWERKDEPTVVVGVTEDVLYAVVGPGTPESRHVPEVKFDGTSIPSAILSVIPKRS